MRLTKRTTYFLLFTYLCLVGTLFANSANSAKFIAFSLSGIQGHIKENVADSLNSLEDLHQLKKMDRRQRNKWITQAPKTIKQALAPYGYFTPQVHATINRQTQPWQANFHIQLGPRVFIHHLDIKISGPGKNNALFKKFKQQPDLQPGQPLITPKYEHALQNLTNATTNLGYLDNQLTMHTIKVNLSKRQATIVIHLFTGARYYFGNTQFIHSHLSQHFLARYQPYTYGQAFSYDKLLELQNNLNNSRYFRHVRVIANKQNAHNHFIPVQVHLTPRKPQVYSIGIGFGTDTGPRVSLGWEWRWTNAYGHYLSALISASSVQKSIMAQYVIPGKHPLSDRYVIFAGAQKIDVSTFNSKTQQVGINYVNQRGKWQRTLGFSMQGEQYQIQTQARKKTFYFLPQVTWVYLNGNKPIFPTQGYKLTFNLRGSSRVLFSQSDFLQFTIRSKTVQQFNRNNDILLRGEIGATVGYKVDQLPASLRFWTGGSQTIRGFGYQAIGGDDGGRYLAVASAEWRHRVYGNWYGAVFYDIGNAMDNFSTPFKRGTGVGVVWKSPLGPVSLTIAKAISEPGKPNRVQFTMGPDL